METFANQPSSSHCKMLAVWSFEEWTVGGAENSRFVSELGNAQIDARLLIHRYQRRRYRYVDVLACPGYVAPIQGCEDGNGCLQSGIDVSMRKAIRARFAQRATIMTRAVRRESRLSLHGRRICHAPAPRTALAVTGDRRIDQPWVASRQRVVIQPEEAQLESSRR
jgi:hypothetical protein